MSCGQLALQKANIKVDNYFASEVDPYAMKVAKHNFPNIKHIGDVTKVKAEDLPKIDLLIGGSPCQGFSFAGDQLAFDDPRSALFFEFVRLLEETKPKYFLLENVKMKKQFQDVISKYLGVEPIVINSSLLSAQNRVRLYWTNIPNVQQPEDLGVLLKDVLEDGYTDRDKSYCLDASYYKGGNPEQYFNKSRRQLVFERPCDIKEFKESSLCHHIATATDISGNESIKRVYAPSGKSPALTTMQGGHREPKVSITGTAYRKLTPLECERLQTVPDNYTLVLNDEGKQLVSNSQRYKMLGNGWTVDVISHILKGIK